MYFNIHYLKHFILPCAFFAVIVFVAMFAPQTRDWLLPILFLLLPFFDLHWRIPKILFKKKFLISWIIFSVVIIVLLFQNTQLVGLFTVMVLVAALPEEWFFRAYLQKQFRNGLGAVLIVSLMFTLMHYIVRGSVEACLVFIPSVFFGWTYKKTGDLMFVVILHAFSNLVYYVYLESYVKMFLAR